jgi:hypothetical protein
MADKSESHAALAVFLFSLLSSCNLSVPSLQQRVVVAARICTEPDDNFVKQASSVVHNAKIP